jgi:hypothetical protein
VVQVSGFGKITTTSFRFRREAVLGALMLEKIPLSVIDISPGFL